MWEYTRARYIIPDEGKRWVYNTLNDAWRVYKSRVKAKHYNAFITDEERIEKRPDDIPLEDFKMLLKYWGDEEVQDMAFKNSARRSSFVDTHTMGPKTLAQVRNKMIKERPDHAPPSDADVFLETRKRKPGREYKTNTKVLEKKINKIKKLVNSGKQEDADAMVTSDKDHGRNWLRGRPGQSSSSAVPSDNNYVNELTAKIKHDLERELEARLNIKVQENMTMMLKRLGNANPDLKLDLGDFCPTISSEQDDTGTPLTGGTTD
nr:PREDICTED: uncharacterized protein LOC108203844 [Daucus carota subsp. sativus]